MRTIVLLSFLASLTAPDAVVAFVTPDATRRSRASAFVVVSPRASSASPVFVAAEVEGAADSDAAVSGGESTAPEWPSAAEPERHTAFVGNLPFDTSEADVRGMFEQYGAVGSVALPKNKETNLPRGFAFVDMIAPDALETAIRNLDGSEYRERPLKVTKSVPKEQLAKDKPARRPRDPSEGGYGRERASAPRPADPEGCKKLYVGNLPFDVRTDEVRAVFAGFGEVVDAFVPTDRATGAGRGFAFVTMKEEDADRAIEGMNGQEFQGRRLVVNQPLPPGERRAPRENTGRGARGGSRNFNNNNNSGPRDNQMKLYVGNLSFYTNAGTLRELFEEFGTVHDCYLPEDTSGNGGSRGFGFVTMDKDAAEQAIEELDGCEIDGRMIRVNAAQAKRFGGGGGGGRNQD